MTNQEAIKAKKITVENDVKIGNLTWKAGTTLYKCDKCSSLVSYKQNYCSICGQKLDWNLGEKIEFKDPDCYTPNDNPYPLCKCSEVVGLHICEWCCIYENYAGDEPPYED